MAQATGFPLPELETVRLTAVLDIVDDVRHGAVRTVRMFMNPFAFCVLPADFGVAIGKLLSAGCVTGGGERLLVGRIGSE